MRSVVRIYLSPPFFLCPRTQGFRLDRHGLRRLERRPLRRNYGDVAQFGRAPPLHGGGCRFEPGHLHQLLGSPGAATRKPSGSYTEAQRRSELQRGVSWRDNRKQVSPSWSTCPGVVRALRSIWSGVGRGSSELATCGQHSSSAAWFFCGLCSLTIWCCLVVVSLIGHSLIVGLWSSRHQRRFGAGSTESCPGVSWLLGKDCRQATKGTRWMFWRQEAMKDVAWLR